MRMTRARALSHQTLKLLAVLADAPAAWHHGYEVAQLAGLKSGTLYPILMRLESQGYLKAQWQDTGVAGRPLRHAYRLTAAGRQLATEQLQASTKQTRSAAS
jgi:PadR family transcriptional regulator, regulatory protein PadR